jgi:putative sigma-54 modulation protein
MKITYTGIKQELSPKLQRKLDLKFAKLSKLLEKRGEIEAHVVVSSVRHLFKAEITVPYYEHQLIGLGSDADLFTALSEAVERLESQALKNRGKWREKHRRKDEVGAEEAAPPAESKRGSSKGPKGPVPAKGPVNVFRVNHHNERKPMTMEEAILEMDPKSDYVVYRDAESENVSVLVRRRDGHFDLIES